MATRQEIVYIDDIDGEPAARTVEFMLDGVHYEIELSATHVIEMVNTLNPFITHARKVSNHNGPKRDRSSNLAQQGKERRADIRAWASKQGIKVPERGRIAGKTIDLYNKAHGKA